MKFSNWKNSQRNLYNIYLLIYWNLHGPLVLLNATYVLNDSSWVRSSRVECSSLIPVNIFFQLWLNLSEATDKKKASVVPATLVKREWHGLAVAVRTFETAHMFVFLLISDSTLKIEAINYV